ncbi:hypothetical protein ACTA71_008347 [Dictyostelium dimigraforme]
MEEVKLILWNFRGNNTKKQNNQENSFSGFEDIYDHMQTTAAASVIISKTGTDAEEMEKQPPNKSNNNQSQPSIVKINKSQKYLKTRNPRNNKGLVDRIYCYPSLLGGNHINFQFMNQYSTTNHNTFQTQQQQLNKPKNQHHNIKQTRKITLVIN